MSFSERSNKKNHDGPCLSRVERSNNEHKSICGKLVNMILMIGEKKNIQSVVNVNHDNSPIVHPSAKPQHAPYRDGNICRRMNEVLLFKVLIPALIVRTGNSSATFHITDPV